MIGNLTYINHKVFKDKDCPVKEFKMVELINEMYWDEWKRLLNESEYPVIEVKHIGLFYVHNGNLRRYIRELLGVLRRIRARKNVVNIQGIMDLDNSITIKLRTALKQLNNLRHVYLARKERKNNLFVETQA